MSQKNISYFKLVLFGIGVWAVLLIGAVLKNEIMVLINLVLVVILLIAKVVAVSYVAIWASKMGSYGYHYTYGAMMTTLLVVGIISVLVAIALNIYFMVVIYSFLKQLKYGSSGSNLPYPI